MQTENLVDAYLGFRSRSSGEGMPEIPSNLGDAISPPIIIDVLDK